MKSVHALLIIVAMTFSTMVFAQSDAQKSFDSMKELAGTWQGPITVDPPGVTLSRERLDRSPCG